jgi:hypothetical protein
LPSGIGGTAGAVTIAVDTVNRPDGSYPCPAVIHTSDEDLPGAATAALTYSITVQLRTFLGDVDNDCDVELDDLSFLLAAFGRCAGQAGFAAAADVDNSGCVELTDLATLLGEFGQLCP